MAVDAHGLRLSAAAPHVPIRNRLYGLGSVFGKTLRDSRLGIVAATAVLGTIIVAGGSAMATTYGTPATRLELATLTDQLPPILRGVYGDPVNVGTLGGFLTWHYGAYFAMLVGLWSIVALSGTIAGEARRGSLDLAVATPHTRRGIAFQKVAGHVIAVGIAMAMVALLAWATGAIFGTMPGDAVPADAAVAFAAGLWVKALIAGSIAFVLAPILGRGAAAGIAGAVMVAGYVLYSYRTIVPAFDSVAGATWFSLTAGHIPLAGPTDWPAVAVLAVMSAVLLGLGIEVFARRDVGGTIPLPVPGLPRVLLGVHGAFRRSLGDLLPTAFAWGVGLGLYGIVIAGSARAVIDTFASAPGLAEILRTFIPGIDLMTSAGFLQLAFVEFGFVLVGLAAATLIAGRSSDETAGRLELQLSTPLTRVRWSVASALAVWLAIALLTALLGAAIAVGVASVGDDPLGPAIGTWVLALYAMALAGIGVGVAGLLRPSLAAPVVVAVAIGTTLLDLLAPALRLPDWVGQLALTTHLGQPMVGTWDGAGIAACLALALGGLAVGAWGMARRDIGG